MTKSELIEELAAGEGRNPRTGAAVSISEKRIPFFKVGKELRQRVDGV